MSYLRNLMAGFVNVFFFLTKKLIIFCGQIAEAEEQLKVE